MSQKYLPLLLLAWRHLWMPLSQSFFTRVYFHFNLMCSDCWGREGFSSHEWKRGQVSSFWLTLRNLRNCEEKSFSSKFLKCASGFKEKSRKDVGVIHKKQGNKRKLAASALTSSSLIISKLNQPQINWFYCSPSIQSSTLLS